MSKKYDNWEKLVRAVLRKEQLKQIALRHSRDLSSISDDFSSFNSSSSSLFHSQTLAPVSDVINNGSIQKRVFLPVEAREFSISSGDFPERQFMFSTLYGDSRMPEVEVNSVLSLDIRGKIKTRLLTPNTIYGAYLVFRSPENFKGLESAEAIIRFVYEDETYGDAEMKAEIVYERKGTMVVRRVDGSMEVEIGSFYIDQGDNGEIIEVRLMETSHWKTGLIVQGIEFRPLVCMR